jgi:hypothetical protein
METSAAVPTGLSKRTKVILIVMVTLLIIAAVVLIYMRRQKKNKADEAKKTTASKVKKVSITQFANKPAVKSPVAIKKGA